MRGFACHPCCHGRGALLPHLFTLTRLRPSDYGAASRAGLPRRSAERREGGRYIFCATDPSGYPARALPGALPYGVRTFLPPTPLVIANPCEGRRSSGRLRRFIIPYVVKFPVR